MSSWSYGVIRFRGEEMGIFNMLKNEIKWCGTDKLTHRIVHHSVVVKKNTYGEPTIEAPEDAKSKEWMFPGFYFKNGNRTILGDGCVIFPAYRYEYCWENEEDERVVWAFDSFHEAYGVEPDLFATIAEKYNLDIRVNAWDKGFGYYSNLIVKADGTIEKMDVIEHKDWAWESEMPQMGG